MKFQLTAVVKHRKQSMKVGSDVVDAVIFTSISAVHGVNVAVQTYLRIQCNILS